MSVKIHLMLNSKMLIDGEGDANVATSVLEASNLVVLKVYNTLYPFYRLVFFILDICYFNHICESTMLRVHPLYIQMQTWEFMDKVH